MTGSEQRRGHPLPQLESIVSAHVMSPTASNPEAYPALRRTAYVIAVLFVITLLSQLDRQLPTLLVGPLREEFGISDTAVGLLQSYAFALSFTLMGLPLGRLVDRRNRRNLIAAGLLFWSAATALFAFGRSYNALLIARLGVGIGEAVLAPAAFSLIADLVAPRYRGRALAVYSVSIALGTGASLLLGGWLMAVIPAEGVALAGGIQLSAWRAAFLAAAAPGLPLALVLLITVREPPRRQDPLSLFDVDDRSSAWHFIDYLRLQPQTFSRLLCFPALLSFIGYGTLAWAPAFFERIHNLPPARSGVVLGIGVALAGTLGMLVGGIVSDRWLATGVPAARLRVAWLGLMTTALPALLWPLVPAMPVAFALLFLLVFGISMAQSAVPTSIQAVFPNRLRGQAVGSYLFLSGLLGIGLGPTAVGLVTDRMFGDDLALRYAIALTTGPVALLGIWFVFTGLAPYALTEARVDAVNG